MREGVIACAELLRRGDPDRFMAVMAAPVAAREKLFPIYAFNVEVSRAPWVTQESMIAEMRLQWWRDALAEISEARPVRRHEVVTPLSEVITAPMATRLDRLVQARRWDIYKDPFQDLPAFYDYIEATSAELLLAACQALGQGPEAPIMAAGRAMGIANFLRAVPQLEAAGRIPLVDGTPQGVKVMAKYGLDQLSTARAAAKDFPPSMRPGLLALWQTKPILRKAYANPGAVAQAALDLSPARRRVRLLVKAVTGRW